ncbi:hypothetical protein A0J61_07675 [Choanephora cucurbitarum]|uniref:Uncharacterized protein n=1 Tax=Choanephora cucurbitarum TaxID=101091 RepID=A0A1C7N563_9FUNG|nr:hypothetical protein A0J61_07675 [Choanephora cucurbitarum]
MRTPYSWNVSVRALPVRCDASTYCPDNNSRCTPTVATGQHCEIQRDDECSGNNAICLNSTCFIKGAPLGGNCGSDLTVYMTYDAAGEGLQQTIIRDNCTEGTYCDNALCIQSKALGSSCEQDRECLSGTCSNDGSCINGPDVFHKVQPWLWGVVGASVVLFVCLVLGLLWMLHRYQSKKEHEKISKFFGDNQEFAKHALMNDDDYSDYDGDSRANQPLNDSRNLVYLTTPDYQLSQALTVGSRNASSSALNQSTPNLSPRAS